MAVTGKRTAKEDGTASFWPHGTEETHGEASRRTAKKKLHGIAFPVLACDQLRLLGATAVYTAAKYEEQSTTLTVNATGVAEICGLHTTKQEVIDMELKMCAVLQYDLSGPTAHTFVEHFTRYSEGEQELEVQQVAHDLARRSLADYRLMQLLPSEVAASAVFLARLILNPKAIQVEQWNKDFEELTGYKPTDLLLGIEPLYAMKDDPRLAVAPAFLDGKFW